MSAGNVARRGISPSIALYLPDLNRIERLAKSDKSITFSLIKYARLWWRSIFR